ncbi:Crp/Fnr family transcriptional regulator [Sphingobacterium spiritivorum]|uniref:Crp/Fnr family transcriptional regulator n=1 Tax=Sphingobacterium spiritivorum TaxID=258 RepID=UPI00191B0921|nr:Crp/Fnr family transcriptional regulator [Sphingobacterium spiritivorum]QQT25700.1 Crp/Fnr family transcriptional regulator [Sphingobacterium spiritivorum]
MPNRERTPFITVYLCLGHNDAVNMMINSYLENSQFFSASEVDAISSYFKFKSLKKGDYFIREGNESREVALIVSGIFRSYYLKENMDEITYCFRFPDELMAAYSSLIQQTPSQENIQAISNAELFVISAEDIRKLDDLYPNWIRLQKTIAEQQYIELEQRIFQLQRQQANQRYADLLQHQPDYIHLIPLHYLATYLGITQRHLSRIRREIVF